MDLVSNYICMYSIFELRLLGGLKSQGFKSLENIHMSNEGMKHNLADGH